MKLTSILFFTAILSSSVLSYQSEIMRVSLGDEEVIVDCSIEPMICNDVAFVLRDDRPKEGEEKKDGKKGSPL